MQKYTFKLSHIYQSFYRLILIIVAVTRTRCSYPLTPSGTCSVKTSHKPLSTHGTSAAISRFLLCPTHAPNRSRCPTSRTSSPEWTNIRWLMTRSKNSWTCAFRYRWKRPTKLCCCQMWPKVGNFHSCWTSCSWFRCSPWTNQQKSQFQILTYHKARCAQFACLFDVNSKQRRKPLQRGRNWPPGKQTCFMIQGSRLRLI